MNIQWTRNASGHLKIGYFRDSSGDKSIIAELWLVDRVVIGRHDNPISLNREQAGVVAAILQRFADTGELEPL
jgi:hypothetical protein